MPASSATSWRRSPGVRRRPPPGSPTSVGRSRARRLRRNNASSGRFSMSSACPRRGAGAGREGGTGGPSLRSSLPPGVGPVQARSMTEIALITGANKGIGFATARQLGARGMTVLLGTRDAERGQAAERTLRDDGIDAHVVQLDVTDPTSVRTAAEWIDAGYGRLGVLVNNAGSAR